MSVCEQAPAMHRKNPVRPPLRYWRRRGIKEKKEFARVLLQQTYELCLYKMEIMAPVADSVVNDVLGVAQYLTDSVEDVGGLGLIGAGGRRPRALADGDISPTWSHGGRTIPALPRDERRDHLTPLPFSSFSTGQRRGSDAQSAPSEADSYWQFEQTYLTASAVAKAYVHQLTGLPVNQSLVKLATQQADSITLMKDELRRMRGILKTANLEEMAEEPEETLGTTGALSQIPQKNFRLFVQTHSGVGESVQTHHYSSYALTSSTLLTHSYRSLAHRGRIL